MRDSSSQMKLVRAQWKKTDENGKRSFYEMDFYFGLDPV